MSEKHKSKYKKPENKKPTYRKDLKDYTADDKDGKMNPYSTKEKQTNVLRKTDKKTVDDGKYDVKYNADDRLYKDLEDGEYDPKHAAKILKKRQDVDEKDNAKNIKDKIENLTREQKEQVIREYIRKRIVGVLFEQEATTPAPEEETPETPEEETPAGEAETAPEGEPGAEGETGVAPEGEPIDTPMPTGGAAPMPSAPAPSTPPVTDPTTPTTEPTAETPEAKAEEDIAKQKIAIKYWDELLASQKGPNSLVDLGFDPIANAMKNLSPKDLRLAKIMILRRLSKIHPTAGDTSTETETV